MQPLDDFATKTRAQLAGYIAEAAKVRRNMPTGHNCADHAACCNCAALLELHARIDDCLNQIDEAALLSTLELELA